VRRASGLLVNPARRAVVIRPWRMAASSWGAARERTREAASARGTSRPSCRRFWTGQGCRHTVSQPEASSQARSRLDRPSCNSRLSSAVAVGMKGRSRRNIRRAAGQSIQSASTGNAHHGRRSMRPCAKSSGAAVGIGGSSGGGKRLKPVGHGLAPIGWVVVEHA
jgi:hypothetical protein